MRLALAFALLSHSLFAMFGVVIPTATYYVSPAACGGSDSNNGTSSVTPFLTLAHAVAQSLTNTSVIAIGCRQPALTSSWREEITSPQDGLTVVGFGSATPLLDASVTISAGGWTKTGGFTNVYQVSVTTDNVLGFLRAWQDGVSFARATSMANLDATTSTYLPSGDPNGAGATSFTLFIHTSDSSDPAVNGKTYEYNQHASGFEMTGAHSRIINVKTQRNLNNNGSAICRTFCTMIDVDAEDGTKHNGFVGTGALVYRSTFHNNYYAGQATILCVGFEALPNGENMTFIGNTLSLDVKDALSAGIGGHSNGLGDFGYEVIQRNTISNVGIGMSASNTSNIYASGNVVTGSGGGLAQFQNTVYATGESYTGCTAQCLNANSTGSLTVENSTLTTPGLNNQFILFGSGANATAVINNVTLGPYVVAFYMPNASPSLSVHGTSFTTPGTLTGTYQLAAGYTLSSDFNAFHFTNSLFILGSSGSLNYAAYRAFSGQDANSTNP